MTIRKQTYAEHIRELQNEMETRQIFLQAAIDEIEELKEAAKTRKLTKKEIVRGEELLEISRAHTKWIETHKGEIQNFYAPAVVA